MTTLLRATNGLTSLHMATLGAGGSAPGAQQSHLGHSVKSGGKLLLGLGQCESLGATPSVWAPESSQSHSDDQPRLRMATSGSATGAWTRRQVLLARGPRERENAKPRRPRRPSLSVRKPLPSGQSPKLERGEKASAVDEKEGDVGRVLFSHVLR